jgi:hypothetical protein
VTKILHAIVHRGEALLSTQLIGSQDPYVSLSLVSTQVPKTPRYSRPSPGRQLAMNLLAMNLLAMNLLWRTCGNNLHAYVICRHTAPSALEGTNFGVHQRVRYWKVACCADNRYARFENKILAASTPNLTPGTGSTEGVAGWTGAGGSERQGPVGAEQLR